MQVIAERFQECMIEPVRRGLVVLLASSVLLFSGCGSSNAESSHGVRSGCSAADTKDEDRNAENTMAGLKNHATPSPSRC